MIQNQYSMEELEYFVGVPIHLVHVIRNPFDNIKSLLKMKYGEIGCNLEDVTKYYFDKFDYIVNELGKKFPITHISIDKLCNNSQYEIKRMVNDIGLDTREDYISDCSDLVFDKPKSQDFREEYRKSTVEYINSRMKEIEYLT